jgi:hypothetical protein
MISARVRGILGNLYQVRRYHGKRQRDCEYFEQQISRRCEIQRNINVPEGGRKGRGSSESGEEKDRNNRRVHCVIINMDLREQRNKDWLEVGENSE